MKILKEKKFYSFCAQDVDEHIGAACLENGTWIVVREDGTAFDGSGRRYVSVCEEYPIETPPPDAAMQYAVIGYWDSEASEIEPFVDTDLRALGWTTEADAPVILPMQS